MGVDEVEMPEAVFELLLMEKFHWTPNQIAEIPEKKIREMSMIMRQRESTVTQAKDLRDKAEEVNAKTSRQELGSGGITRYEEV